MPHLSRRYGFLGGGPLSMLSYDRILMLYSAGIASLGEFSYGLRAGSRKERKGPRKEQ